MKAIFLFCSLMIVGELFIGCDNMVAGGENNLTGDTIDTVDTSNILDTIHKPIIIKQPSSATVDLGDSAIFTVGASGGNLKYQWRKDSSDIKYANESVLAVSALQLSDDNSKFDVIVYNDSGLDTSDIVTLTVKDTIDLIAVNDSLSKLFQDSASMILSFCGVIPTTTPEQSEVPIDTIDDPTNNDYQIYRSRVNSAESWSDLNTMGKNDDILYPGALIDGGQLYKSNTYSPLLAKRAPITISISLEGTTGSGDLSTTINDPKLSSVRNGIREIITENQGSSLPVRMDYSQEDIYSEDQMSLALDIPLLPSVISNSLGMDWKSSTKTTKRVYTIKQVAYSVDLDTPDSLFTNENSLDDIKNTFSSDVIPTYVGSVEYGAVLYVVIESELNHSELDGVLGTFAGGNSSPLDSKTSVKIVQYGGSSDLTSVAQTMIEGGDGLDAVVSYLEGQNLGSSLAIPLSYTLRYASNNTIAHVGASCTYTKEMRVKSHITVTCIADSVMITSYDSGEQGKLDNVSVNLTFYYVTAAGEGIIGYVNKIGNDITNSSKYVWQRPNESISHQFKNFNPLTDKIKVKMYCFEDDLFEDDTAVKYETYDINNWNGQSTFDVESTGPNWRYFLSFSMK